MLWEPLGVSLQFVQPVFSSLLLAGNSPAIPRASALSSSTPRASVALPSLVKQRTRFYAFLRPLPMTVTLGQVLSLQCPEVTAVENDLGCYKEVLSQNTLAFV